MSKTNSSYIHQLADDVQEGFKTHGGEGWRPALAYPFFVGFGLRKAKCGCGRTFKLEQDYYAHYLYHAIWLHESNYLPTMWEKFPAPGLSSEPPTSKQASPGPSLAEGEE